MSTILQGREKEFINCKVKHVKFGDGKITAIDEKAGRILIQFGKEVGLKSLAYPFTLKLLTFDETATNAKELVANFEKEEEKAKQERFEELNKKFTGKKSHQTSKGRMVYMLKLPGTGEAPICSATQMRYNVKTLKATCLREMCGTSSKEFNEREKLIGDHARAGLFECPIRKFYNDGIITLKNGAISLESDSIVVLLEQSVTGGAKERSLRGIATVRSCIPDDDNATTELELDLDNSVLLTFAESQSFTSPCGNGISFGTHRKINMEKLIETCKEVEANVIDADDPRYQVLQGILDVAKASFTESHTKYEEELDEEE